MATPRTLVQRIALDGGKEIKRELEALGDEGKRAFQKLERAANDVDRASTKLGRFFLGVRNGLSAIVRDSGTAREHLGRVGDSLSNLGRNSVIAGVALGGVAIAVQRVVDSALTAADAHDEASDAIGINITEYGKLVHAFGTAGVGADKLKSSLNILNRNIAKAAADPAGEAARAFQELGVRIRDAQGNIRPLTDILADMADAFNKLNGGWDALTTAEKNAANQLVQLQREGRLTESVIKQLSGKQLRLLNIALGDAESGAYQASVAMKLMGKSGSDMLPGLKAGGEEMKRLAKQAEVLGVAFYPEMAKRMIQAKDAIDRVGDALAGVRNVVVAALAPALETMANELTRSLVGIRPRIEALATQFAQFLQPAILSVIAILEGTPKEGLSPVVDNIHAKMLSMGEAARLALKVWLEVWDVMRQSVQNVLDVINLLFGTEFSANTVIALAFFLQLAGVFRLIISLVGLIVSGFALAFGGATAVTLSGVLGIIVAIGLALGLLVKYFPQIQAAAALAWEAVSGGAVIAIELIQQGWTALVAWLASIWQSMIDGAQRVGTWIAEQFQRAAELIKQAFGSVVSFIQGIFQSLLNFVYEIIAAIASRIKMLIDAVKEAAAMVASLFGASEGGEASGAAAGGAFAKGGKVRGGGTATSDSIPAWLSNGEFVQRAKAVAYYGTDFMHKLNRLQIPRNLFQGFAEGGLAMLSPAFLMPRMAEGGGPVAGSGGMRTVNLHLDGQSFAGLLAPEAVAEKLVRYVGTKAVRQAGRKPAWYR